MKIRPSILFLAWMTACDEQGTFTVVDVAAAPQTPQETDAVPDTETPQDTEPDAPSFVDNDSDGFTDQDDCDDDDPEVFPGARERCNLIDDDCDDDIDGGEACPCQTLESEQGAFYMFCTEARSWERARDVCTDAGQDLVQIGNARENGLVRSVTTDLSGGTWWLGLNDLEDEGEWVWANGDEPGFTRWGDFEPNDFGGAEDCAEFRTENGTWNDYICEELRPFICELL